MRLANRGGLLLWTPGPFPFWICFVLMFRSFSTEFVILPDFEFRTSVDTFCFLELQGANVIGIPTSSFTSTFQHAYKIVIKRLIYNSLRLGMKTNKDNHRIQSSTNFIYIQIFQTQFLFGQKLLQDIQFNKKRTILLVACQIQVWYFKYSLHAIYIFIPCKRECLGIICF